MVLFFLYSLKNNQASWILIVFILPFIFLMANMFDQPKFNALRLFQVVYLGIFIFSKKPEKFWQILLKNISFIGLILFILANMVSSIKSMEMESVFRSVTYLQSLGFFLFGYFVVRCRMDNWVTLIKVIGVCGIFVILLGLIEIVEQKPIVEIFNMQNTSYQLAKLQYYFSENRFGLGGRISSILLQPVHASIFFCIYLICQTFYILEYRKNKQVWLLVLVPLAFILIILTGSRGPVLALGLALLFYLAINTLSRKKIVPIIIAVIIMGVLAVIINYQVPVIRDYLIASFDPSQDESANFLGRIKLTDRLFDIFMANPIFGYGPGLIQKSAAQGVSDFIGLEGIENEYAAILADGGIISGLAYLVFVIGVFYMVFKGYRSNLKRLRNAATMVSVLAVFYFLVVTSVFAFSNIGGFLFLSIVGGFAGLLDSYEVLLSGYKRHIAAVKENLITG